MQFMTAYDYDFRFRLGFHAPHDYNDIMIQPPVNHFI